MLDIIVDNDALLISCLIASVLLNIAFAISLFIKLQTIKDLQEIQVALLNGFLEDHKDDMEKEDEEDKIE